MAANKVNRTLVVLWLMLIGIYFIYRLLFTIPSDARWFGILFYIAELHGAMTFALFCFETWATHHPTHQTAPPGLAVDIYICTYNEDPELLRKTVLGAQAISYPHATYVLDDGRRDSVRELSRALGVNYITRPDNSHAKAGNINHALPHTSGDFIAILDADHVPLSDFLDRMLGHFTDPRVAFVQSPQTYYNLDALEQNVDYESCALWEEAEVFFHLLLPGKNRWNAAIFCGTGGILRRTALEDVGGFATDTITEDIHTSILMHSRGWRSVYVAEHLASGQAPRDLPSYHQQRTRWALGNLRTMLISNPLTLPGLTLAQRLCYLSSMMHWMNGLHKTVMYATPLLALLVGIYPVAHATPHLIAVYFTQLACTLAVFKFLTRGRGRVLAGEVFSMLNFWVLTSAFVRACLKLGTQVFKVTGRDKCVRLPLTSIKPQLTLLGLSVIAGTWGVLRAYYGVGECGLGLVIAMFWMLWNAALAICAVRTAAAPSHASNDIRFADHIPVLYRLPEMTDNPERLAVTLDYSERTMSLVTYEPLQVGERLSATLILRFFRLSTQMTIVRALSQSKPQEHRIFRYEVSLDISDQAARDMLHTHTMLYTTPRLLDALGERGKKAMHSEDLNWLSQPRGGRRRIDFPVTLDPAHNTWVHSRVERFDEDRVSLLVETPIPEGLTHPLLIGTPLGTIEGELEVLSNEPRHFHGSPMFSCDARVAWRDDQTRQLVKEFTNA